MILLLTVQGGDIGQLSHTIPLLFTVFPADRLS